MQSVGRQEEPLTKVDPRNADRHGRVRLSANYPSTRSLTEIQAGDTLIAALTKFSLYISESCALP
jgi:hypothetical protein